MKREFTYIYIFEDGSTQYSDLAPPSTDDLQASNDGVLTIIRVGVGEPVYHMKDNDWLPIELKKEEADLGKPITKKEFGLHLEMKDFVRQCKEHSFVDDDGTGYYASACRKFKKNIRPSEVVAGTHDKRFTHILWYNK